MTVPASTITQSHCGRPEGLGHFTPIFFNWRVISSAVESACRLDRQVAITKKSAMDVLFFKSITIIFSDLVLSSMVLTFSTRFILLLIVTP